MCESTNHQGMAQHKLELNEVVGEHWSNPDIWPPTCIKQTCKINNSSKQSGGLA